MTPPAQRARLDAPAVGLMLVLCTLWGVQQVGAKVAVEQGLPPLFQAGVRSLAATGLLGLWVLARTGRAGLARLFVRDGSLGPGGSIAVLFGLEFVFLYSGVQRTSASRAVLLLYTAPFFTALGAHLAVPGERLRPVHVLGLAVAFAGVVATVLDRGPAAGSLRGDALVFAGAAAWGVTTVVIKASPALRRIPPTKILLYQIGGSTPLLLGAAALAGQLAPPRATGLAWGALAYQAVVVAFASYLAWFWLVARYPAGKLSAFAFLTPLIGIAAAALLLGEPATPALLLGLACVAAGLRLVNAR